MKHIILFCLIACLPRIAASQDSINPYNTQLSNTIELHNTDVYYRPMAPPALTDTSWVLSSQSAFLTDLDGIYTGWPGYEPRTHGVLLKYWHPYDIVPVLGDSLGIGAHWQRFFTAKRHGGVPSDIIAGGSPGDRVIISKNEDVDFRASGRIKLKSGFHARAGCKFHAYTEPTWGDTVFSDDFTSLNRAR